MQWNKASRYVEGNAGIGSRATRGLATAATLIGLLTVVAPSAARDTRAIIAGAVRGDRDTTLANAKLRFFAADRAKVTEISTDANGAYALSLPLGSYDIEVTPPAGRYVRQLVTGQNVDADRTLDIALVEGAISVYDFAVRDQSRELVTRDIDNNCGAVLGYLLSADDLRGAASGQNESGSNVSLLAPAGEYRVQYFAAFCEPDFSYDQGYVDVTLQAERSVPGAGTEIFQAPGRTLSGRLVDEQGVPLVGERVAVETSISNPEMLASGYDPATTDEDGRFSVFVLDGPGRWTVGWSTRITYEFSSPPSSDVELVLPTPSVYALHLTDDDGDLSGGSPFCRYSTELQRPDLILNASDWLDVDGFATITAPPGEYTASLRLEPCAFSNTGRLPFSFYGKLVEPQLVEDGQELHEWQLPTHVFTGTVRRSDGSPLAGVPVHARVATVSEGWDATVEDRTSSDSLGRFSLKLMAGKGTLIVDGKKYAIDTRVPASMNVIQSPTVPFVVDATGGPAATQCGWGQVASNLFAAADAPYVGTSSTWGTGFVTSQAQPGNYLVDLYVEPACESPVFSPRWWGHSTGEHAAPGNLSLSAALDVAELTLSVLDPDGKPLGTYLDIFSKLETEDWEFSSRSHPYSTQPISMLVSPEFTEIATANGFGASLYTTLRDASNQALLLGVQFRAEVTAPSNIAPNGSISTDDEADGTTASDPLETTLRSPRAGRARILEAPITEVAPTGYQFITQQVELRAPRATERNPLTLDLRLDASRFDPTFPNDIQLFHAGERVTACRYRAGRASPDPCIQTRQLADDGSLMLRVLSTTDGHWNFGTFAPECGRYRPGRRPRYCPILPRANNAKL